MKNIFLYSLSFSFSEIELTVSDQHRDITSMTYFTLNQSAMAS